jgi:hypothetical protein
MSIFSCCGHILFSICDTISYPFLHQSRFYIPDEYPQEIKEPTLIPVKICNMNSDIDPNDALTDEKFLCSICVEIPKQVVFDCGHMVCIKCSQNLIFCPFCRNKIDKKIRMYNC